MAMGTKRAPLPLWIDSESVVKGPGHPFYRKLSSILDFHGFDRFVEERCRKYYKPGGRPSLPPSVYFRLSIVGYFEGIGSERAIAWKLVPIRSPFETSWDCRSRFARRTIRRSRARGG